MFLSLRVALDRVMKKKNLASAIAAVTTQEKAEKIILTLFQKKTKALVQKNNTLVIRTSSPALCHEITLKQEQLKKAFAKNNLIIKKVRCVS